MFKFIFKVLFKVLLALGIVAGALAILQYLDHSNSDYIEIYNDEDDELDGEYY